MSTKDDPDAQSPIDNRKLDRLRIVLGNNLPEAMGSFLKQSRIYIDAIQTAIKDRRPSDAMGIAHKLKSSAGLYGLKNVVKYSNAIEHCQWPYDTEIMGNLHAELDGAFLEASKFLDGEFR